MRFVQLAALVILQMLICVPALTQTCRPIFKKSYGGNGNDETRSIIATSDNGSIVAGRSNSGTAGDYDALLLKLSEDGNLQWSRRYGGNGDDIFLKVKQTTDGGFISIGTTSSFGNPQGEVWVVKTDAAGNNLWARHYGKPGIYTKGKEIIQLSDGSFLFIANENDSTALSNGIVCRIDAVGSVLWTKTFDNGNDDGFNTIVQSGNEVYVGGYATVDLRDGILMKLSVADGSILSSKKYIRRQGWHDEIIDVQLTLDGISFGSRSYNNLSFNSYYAYLTLFKTKTDGTITFQRNADISFNQYRPESFQLRMTRDSGYIFASCDTTPYGTPVAASLGPTGMNEWGRNFTHFENSKLYGVDVVDSTGYIFGGHLNTFQTGFKNDITVFRTDINGYVNDCIAGFYGVFVDTTYFSISAFNWSSADPALLPVSNVVNPAIADAGFIENSVCTGQYCVGAAPVADTCNATFLMRYRSPQYIKSWDIGIASDGGMLMTGYFGMGIQVEPLLTKLKKNGDVAWAQTLNNYMHTGLFKKVLRTADGNNLLLGVDNYTVNHGSGDSSILMKINDNTGEVIWARYCKGDIYNITETDDGGFVFCLNENYGFPPIGTYLARIDGNGNIMWQRRIGTDIGGAAVYRGIVYDQSNIYLAADYYNAHPASSLLLERWDATTGTRIWEQRFLIPGEEFYLESLSKIGDTLFTGININTTSFPFTLNFGVFKASINGAGLGGFKFTVPDVSLFPVYNYSYFNEHLVSRFTSTSDDKFVFADQCVVNGDTLLQIRKFTTTGDVLWSRKYPNIKKSYVTAIKELDNKLLIFGRTQKGIIDNTIATDAFLMKTDSIGKVNDATTGDCYSEPSGASTEELPPFQIIPLTPATPVSPGTIVFRDYSPYKRPVNIWAEVACNIPSACNNIVTTGPVTICNTADTVVYSALRNPGCISAVNWVVDTARVKIVSSTDTSIRVYFTGYGNTQIKARLVAGCSFKTDAINVSVVRNADSLNLGPDVDVCPSTPVTLFAGTGYKNYTWQDGSTSTWHAALAPGIYYVDAEDSCGRIKRDSVTVTWFTRALMTAGPDKIKCNADTIHLAATTGLTGYTWTPAYNIQTPQSSMIVARPLVDTTYYVLAVDQNGCNVHDTIRVKVNQSPPIDLGTDKSFCAGDSAVLDAGPSFQGYAWSNGSTSQTITVRASGLYNVVGTASNGCHSSDTLAIDKVFALPSGFLNPEALFCVKDSAELKSTRAYSSYLWNTGATTQSIYVRQSGMYWLEATDNNGCKAKEFVEAKQQQCIQGVYFPSAFTPDNNGRNDFFKPLVYERVTNYTFSIYNRWGQLVFTTRNTTAGWDGKVGGVPQDANVFVWVCTYQPEGSRSLREVKGTFVLIR